MYRDHYEERAAILEHDAGLSREKAETRAYSETVRLWLTHALSRRVRTHGSCQQCGEPGAAALGPLCPAKYEAGEVHLHQKCREAYETYRKKAVAEALASYGVARP
jgi:hypothetical protein